MRLFNLTFLILIALVINACTYSVHQVPLSDFKPYAPESKGKQIQSQSKQFVILGIASETNYVDQAYKQLQGQCINGTVTGIATKYYTEHGFFSWTNHIVMQGLCI
jgi:hypothetical protein